MEVRVLKFNSEYLNDIAASFVESFPEWSMKEAKNYLLQADSVCPGYCWVAVSDKGKPLGAIFSKICPYNNGKMIFIESLQIIKKYREKGVGTLLMEKLLNIAKENKIKNMGMLVSKRKKFPMVWFKMMGFKETGWIELAADIVNIRIIDVSR